MLFEFGLCCQFERSIPKYNFITYSSKKINKQHHLGLRNKDASAD
uniref:Uncharacterized protein n=1 Tax=Arundo donax TaxID=35708 RepID=A0A0A9E9N4_ARUDO